MANVTLSLTLRHSFDTLGDYYVFSVMSSNGWCNNASFKDESLAEYFATNVQRGEKYGFDILKENSFWKFL